jgi:thiosulfate/3-mercaptopyruvate sulfurtransferase
MPISYTHPESLVSTEWLAGHIDDPLVKIIDGSFKMPGIKPTARADYDERHIIGAVLFDIDEIKDQASPLPHMLPSAEYFGAAIGRLGIHINQKIVVYDSAGIVSAPRVWWMFRAFGYDNVGVLNGGLPKWLGEGRAATNEPTKPTSGVHSYSARLNQRLLRSKAQLLSNLETKRDQVLDARTRERFEGKAAEPWPGRRPGRIPGSLNLPYTMLVDPAAKTLLPAEELQRRYRDAGIAPDRPIVTSCGSGVTACVLAFGLHLLGRDDVAVYDGSWAEWGLPGETPVATGAP